MGVFSRLSDLLKSNVNDLIDRAEDPEKMVKQVIIDMQAELTKATQNYGKAKASERLAEKKYLDAQKISESWENKAKTALAKGDQDLAKQALARKVKADEDLKNYKEMYYALSRFLLIAFIIVIFSLFFSDNFFVGIFSSLYSKSGKMSFLAFLCRKKC